MSNDGGKKKYDIGVIGLGVMGRNFAQNIADHGFSVAGYDRDPEKMQALIQEKSPAQDLRTGPSMDVFLGLLARPRAVVILVPAGGPVDAVLEALLPHLEPGDLIIDSGNSRFTDTDRRLGRAEDQGVHYLGMGISGGEQGARRGPSLMPGGSREGYERVRPILEAAAAKVGEDPCVAYLGPGSAGHYVKMVHNGIEYALMQLISETYDVMKRGLGMAPEALHGVYDRWNRGELNSYLIEITSDIFRQKDSGEGTPLIDRILDAAKQKGTGEWTVQDALDLQLPTPNIDVAVMMRNLSGYKKQRERAGRTLQGPDPRFEGEPAPFLRQLQNALYAAMIITFAQGMALLEKASDTYGYHLDPEAVARIWRGGCIIRAALLEEIRSAYKSNSGLDHLLLDGHLGQAVTDRQADLRAVVCTGAALGLPVPGLMAALSYLDAFRSGWLPANLVMAQRDYFGAHTYERVDREGTFHTHWGK